MTSADPDLHPTCLRWDIFCRVVDNHGDLGVCWRLACRLAALGQTVRLWIDDASALAWMAPVASRPQGIEVRDWAPLGADEGLGDVMVETFGGDLPPGWLERMAASPQPPTWIDVEYLSAESYVERNHGLPSPQSAGPAAGLTRWFFYPGFTPRTGGLLLNSSDEREGQRVLQRLGLDHTRGTTTVSLFGYATPQLDAAFAPWRSNPTRLLACPGAPARQLAAMLGVSGEPGTQAGIDALTVHWLPWLTQPDYDALLHVCDLNLVRGEDSFVQALASGRPFIWQIYPQADGVHAVKLAAFLDRYLANAPPALAAELRTSFAAWNCVPNGDDGGARWHPPLHGSASPWRQQAEAWSRSLHAEQEAFGDLGLRLYRYAAARR